MLPALFVNMAVRSFQQGRNISGRIPYQAFIDGLPKSGNDTQEAG